MYVLSRDQASNDEEEKKGEEKLLNVGSPQAIQILNIIIS
jgi:hypothetical protein